jgi:hypothetical protein
MSAAALACGRSPPAISQRADPEAAWRLAAAMDVPHGLIGRLDMAVESVGIEQRARIAILSEPAADRGSPEGSAASFNATASYSSRLPVTSSGRPAARSRLAQCCQQR